MSESRKDDGGKPRMDLVTHQWVEGVARVLTFGAQKYDPWNWAKGMAWSRLIGATQRHFGAWKSGEDFDPETGQSHLLHASCCLMFLYMYQMFGRGTDDRYKFARQPLPGWTPAQGTTTEVVDSDGPEDRQTQIARILKEFPQYEVHKIRAEDSEGDVGVELSSGGIWHIWADQTSDDEVRQVIAKEFGKTWE